MASVKNKAEPAGLKTYEVWPGYAVVRATMPDPPVAHVFLVIAGMHRGYSDLWAYPLVPGIDYVVPASVIRSADATKMIKSGQLKIVDTDRGVLVDPVDISDSVTRATLRDGVRPGQNRRSQIEHLRDRWIADDSFAVAMLGLIESGGWTETEAAAALERTYREAFAHGKASQRPWVALAVRLLEARGLDIERFGLQGVRQAVRERRRGTPTAQAGGAQLAQERS